MLSNFNRCCIQNVNVKLQGYELEDRRAKYVLE